MKSAVAIVLLAVLVSLAMKTAGTGDIADIHDVGRVIDGDTFVTEDGQRVRLWGIDAPEMGSPGGEAAKDMLEALTAGRTLVCVEKDIDRYGRTVAQCEIWLSEHDIACLMVERGHARVHEVGVGDYDGKTQPTMVESLSFPDVTYIDLKEEIDDKKVALMEEGEDFGEQTSFDQSDIKEAQMKVRNVWLRKLYEYTDYSMGQLSEELKDDDDIEALSSSRIGQIVNAD